MQNRLKLSHRRHSGRWRPHEYTSYPVLFLLLFVVGFALSLCSVYADTPYTTPGVGSVGLSGQVPEKPPTQAAVIQSPTNGQTFGNTPITVSGTCPDNTVVEIFKNDVFAGSELCSSSNTFSLQVDLLYGTNILIAKVYDALDQAGPDSNQVTVTYTVPPAQAANLAPLNLSGAQLLLNTTAIYRGVFPGQTLSVPISILGGTPPYAINLQWGDSSNKVVPRPDNLTFDMTHIYNKPGNYQITAQATDADSRVAYLTVAAIVNGQPVVASTSTPTTTKQAASKLLVLWPLYAIMLGMVIAFWYGERREKRILGGPYLNLHPQG